MTDYHAYPSPKLMMPLVLISVVLFIAFIYFSNISTTCDDRIRMNIFPEEGSLKIDTIYVDWRSHLDVMQNRRGLHVGWHGDMVRLPEVGDSIVKKKGSGEYTLITNDSIYVQKWSCEAGKAVITYQNKR